MNRRLAYGLLILSACLFGCSGIWGKILFQASLTPLQITAFRTIVAALCIAVFASLRGGGDFRITKEQFLFLAAFCVMLTLVQLSFYVSIALTSVAVALTLQYTAPIFVVAWEKFRYDRPIGARRLLSILAALAGCALVADIGNPAFLSANLPGVLVGVASGLILAVYSMMGNTVPRRGIGTVTSALYAFSVPGIAWIVLLPAYAPAPTDLDSGLVGQILLLGVLATFLPFLLLILGLRHVGAYEATLISMLDPVAGALLAYAILGESLSLPQMLGMALVLGAVAKAGSAPR